MGLSRKTTQEKLRGNSESFSFYTHRARPAHFLSRFWMLVREWKHTREKFSRVAWKEMYVELSLAMLLSSRAMLYLYFHMAEVENTSGRFRMKKKKNSLSRFFSRKDFFSFLFLRESSLYFTAITRALSVYIVLIWLWFKAC